MADARRSIPSVDRLLSSDSFAVLRREWPHALIASALDGRLTALRVSLSDDTAQASAAAIELQPDRLAADVRADLERLAAGSLVPMINATGVVLHTNLGRAPLADAALRAIADVARGYSNLEYDIGTGARGSRYAHCRDLLCRLTGAEDALVVNNNAAALVLALNTFAHGRDAVVSRGELVEIGGAFRVPEIMARSGARLREVGATNRTHIDDYRGVTGADTGALLKVHPSNFTMEGYTAEVTVRELAGVAAAVHVPLIHDIGSGLLLDAALLGIAADEPTPHSSLEDGADIVTMSGDKLLGGPQCGIVLGSTPLVERMRRNPLCRALRVDKLTLAALAATLRLYLDPERARREIPVLRMLSLDTASITARAAAIARECERLGLEACTRDGSSAVGGGAAPNGRIPTVLVLFSRAGTTVNALERLLRTGSPGVVTRIVDDHVAIDVRTVAEHEDARLVEALGAAAAATQPERP